MIRKWRLKTGEYSSEYPWKINDGDLISNKLKVRTNIHGDHIVFIYNLGSCFYN